MRVTQSGLDTDVIVPLGNARELNDALQLCTCRDFYPAITRMFVLQLTIPNVPSLSFHNVLSPCAYHIRCAKAPSHQPSL